MWTFIAMTMVTAFRVLGRNRLRAGLTMLGIIIGVGAVIAMVGIGQGAKEAVRAQVATMGTNLIIVWLGSTTVGGVRNAAGGAVTLTVADAQELKKKIPLLVDTGWAKRDVTQIISQLPPIIESLTGVKFEKLLEQVPALKKAMGKDDAGESK